MIAPSTRRAFLRKSAALALGSAASVAAKEESFSFVLLGDLHYDKLEHHDMAWLEKHKAGDIAQIRNYSRLTAGTMPALFASVKESVAASGASFVLQIGDLVEGLCGSAELAARQNREAIAFVRGADLGVPFLFTKGNHDVTGDGAVEAFEEVLLPFMREERRSFAAGGADSSANYAIEKGDSLFCCLDAYAKSGLEWLEAVLANRGSRQCFVVVHPPVVPYGARATWHLYAKEREAAMRGKLLELLGRNEVIVLGGHLHKFCNLVRTTSGGGRFTQFALSSVVSTASPEAKTILSGPSAYNGDQVLVEPNHSPDTVGERRAVYEAERPHVTAFEYADLPGHAVVTVRGRKVTATLFSGTGRRPWRTIDLSAAAG